MNELVERISVQYFRPIQVWFALLEVPAPPLFFDLPTSATSPPALHASGVVFGVVCKCRWLFSTQRETFRCSLACTEQEQFTSEETKACIERCNRKADEANQFFNNALQSVMVRVCVMCVCACASAHNTEALQLQ